MNWIRRGMTLERYLFTSFLKAFLGSVGFFSLMFIIVSMSQELAWLLQVSDRTSTLNLFLYFGYRLPFWLTYTYPLSALYAIVFVLGKMNAENELIAVYNAGVPLDRILIPVYLFVFLLSTAFLVFDKEIFYTPNQKFRALLQNLRDPSRKEFEGPRVRENLTVFGANNKIYFIRLYHQTNAVLQDTHILYLDRKMNFSRLLSAQYIRWGGPGGWTAQGVVERQFSGGDTNNMRTSAHETMKLDLEETPFHFEETYEREDLLAARDALRIAKKYEIIGGDFRAWYTIYYAKTAMPYIAFVILFFGVPLSTFSRRSTLVLSFLLVLLATFLYYIFNQVGQSLGKWGALPTWMAGWFGAIGFMSIGVALRRFLRV